MDGEEASPDQGVGMGPTVEAVVADSLAGAGSLGGSRMSAKPLNLIDWSQGDEGLRRKASPEKLRVEQGTDSAAESSDEALANELDDDLEDENQKVVPAISVSQSIDPSTFSEASDDDDLFGGGLS